MQKSILYFLLTFSIAIAGDLINLDAVDRSANFYLDVAVGISVAAHQNTIVTQALGDPNNLASNIWVLMKQDGNGEYQKMATLNAANGERRIALNNGRWVGGFVAGFGLSLYEMNATGSITNNPTTIPLADAGIVYATLLSDDTIVYVDFDNSTVSSLIFNADAQNWGQGPSIALENPLIFSLPFTSYHIDDNFVLYVNSSHYTFIYQRLPNGSWKLIDGFAFDADRYTGTAMNLFYNGGDTVVFAFPESNLDTNVPGYIVLYTKVNGGQWVDKVIAAEDVGFTGDGTFLGERSIAAVGNDFLLFGAPTEGFVNSGGGTKRGAPTLTKPYGKVLILHRQNNTWEPAAIISTPDIGILGGGIGITNTDVVITMGLPVQYASAFSYNFYTVPLCVFFPIAATCFDQSVDTCNVDTTNITPYTVMSCGPFDTQVSISNKQEGENSVTLTFEFERTWSPVVRCNSTLTCSAPSTPINSPSSAPSKVSGATLLTTLTSSGLITLLTLI